MKKLTEQRFEIHLEDMGQDFLYFIVEGRKIIETHPFQGFVWNGRIIVSNLVVGGAITFDDGNSLKYRITKIEPVKKLAKRRTKCQR